MHTGWSKYEKNIFKLETNYLLILKTNNLFATVEASSFQISNFLILFFQMRIKDIGSTFKAVAFNK